MSGVIKQERAALAVERWPGAGREAPPPPVDPRVAGLEARIAELERALAGERRGAQQAAAEAKRAVVAAREAGRREAVADEAERIALIEAGIAEALSAWRARLATIDALAADLAAVVLGKLFGDAPDYREMVRRTLAHHVERIGRHAVVAVTVSAQDFGDAAAVAELGLGEVACAGELPAGACRVRLRLGAVELDPVAQWAVIDAALREMAA